MEQACISATTARVIASGPLRPVGSGFLSHLRTQGFNPATLRSKSTYVAELGQWLARHDLGLEALSDARIREFLRVRRSRRRGAAAAAAACFQLLRYAQSAKLLNGTEAAHATNDVPRIALAYRDYLRRERGLADVTCDNYIGMLVDTLVDGPLPVRDGRGVIRFVVRQTRDLGVGRAKLLITALRSFLRFLHCTGRSPVDLAPSVPTVPDWRDTRLPRAIGARDVRRIVCACDTRTARGRRDRAVLLLLARLGLRAGEVVHMTLEDIDWHAGELVVRGKGSRLDRLPLPADVGSALVAYLRDRHAVDGSRRMFLTNRAPRRPFTTSATVSTIVARAIQRAGLQPPSRGAHLLRHSLATDLLRRGASLSEIGELLRHRGPDTTMIYAKVDLAALRDLARPWPGGAS